MPTELIQAGGKPSEWGRIFTQWKD